MGSNSKRIMFCYVIINLRHTVCAEFANHESLSHFFFTPILFIVKWAILNRIYSVVSLARGLGPCSPPVTETLRAESRAVTCCHEDGRLTFGGWVVVVKE